MDSRPRGGREGIDTTAPWGSVLFALFAGMAEIESTTRSDRLAAWHEQRAKKGLPSGGGTRAFGFEPDGVALVPDEADLIRDAVGALLDGSNLTRVVREWNEAGVTTPTGGRWSKTSFRRMILSARIAGVREHRDEVYPARWPPIIPYDDHTRLRALYSAPGQQSARRYVLTGIAVCGLCGSKLVARPKGDGRRCYTCASNEGGCGKIRTLAAPVEALVAREVDRWYSDHPQPTNAGRDTDALRRQLAADEQALDELARDRYVTRSISATEFVAARDPLVRRIADAQERLRGTSARLSWTEAMADQLEAPWELPPGTDPDPDDFAYWRRWIGEAVEVVKIGPAVRGRNFFDPSRVTIAFAERR
jgi:site-specific DNA recombinase